MPLDSATPHKAKRIPFKVDIAGVIEIMGTSLYSHPNTPIRELLQNAHDAIMRRTLERLPSSMTVLGSHPKKRKTILEHSGSELRGSSKKKQPTYLIFRCTPTNAMEATSSASLASDCSRRLCWLTKSSSKVYVSREKKPCVGKQALVRISNFRLPIEQSQALRLRCT